MRVADGAVEDIRDLRTLGDRIRGCDGIFHLAAVSRVAWGERDPDLCHSVNVEGTRRVIEAALAAPAPILLIAFLIAIFATVIPSYMINFALGRIGADGTAVVGNAGPLFTIAMSALILGEPFGPLEAAGATLVIAGMVMFSRR